MAWRKSDRRVAWAGAAVALVTIGGATVSATHGGASWRAETTPRSASVTTSRIDGDGSRVATGTSQAPTAEAPPLTTGGASPTSAVGPTVTDAVRGATSPPTVPVTGDGTTLTTLPAPTLLVAAYHPPIPGAPTIVVRLDDAGVHVTPPAVPGGTYNISFTDERSHRDFGDDLAYHVYVSGPLRAILSVRAGTTGGAILCPGAVADMVTLDRHEVVGLTGDHLAIEQSGDCTTPVT